MAPLNGLAVERAVGARERQHDRGAIILDLAALKWSGKPARQPLPRLSKMTDPEQIELEDRNARESFLYAAKSKLIG